MEFGKVAIIVVPVFAGSIAVCYDVGFFAGLDLRFFSFFSLSEHIVFSLQAIPFALPSALTLFALIAVSWWGYKLVAALPAKTDSLVSKMNADELAAYTAKVTRRVKAIKIMNPLVKAILLAFAIWILLAGNYAGAYLFLVSEVLAWMIFPTERIAASKTMQFAVFGFLIVSTWITASLVGYGQATRIAQSAAPTEKITFDDQEIQANLVRGGDRGVLFVVFQTKKLRFLRWEAIKKIESF
jgi:hypothetical protein